MVDYSCDTCINQYTNKCNHCMVTEYHGQMLSVPTNYKRKPCPCDDAISRDAVLKRIVQFSVEEGSSVRCQPLYSDINNMPSVQPSRVECEDVINRTEVLDQLAQAYNIIDATNRIKAMRGVK